MLPKGLTIAAEGEIVSGSYVDMTVAVQKRFGVIAQLVDANAYRYEPSRYVGCNYVVEPDASSASYPMAAVAIVGGSITIKDFALSSLQGDAKFLGVLENMGCQVEVRGDDIVVTRDSSRMLKGITVDMRDMSDLVPTLAVVASFASTPTTISGVGFIRKKESDRIGDLANEMRKLGVRVDEHDDGLVIHPSEHHGGVVETHHDHRLAMSLALIGLAVEDVVISQPDVVSKSWPEYWSMLDSLK
jgi:3-phosphoshikimate 1-carboxyvinyltransferase